MKKNHLIIKVSVDRRSGPITRPTAGEHASESGVYKPSLLSTGTLGKC